MSMKHTPGPWKTPGYDLPNVHVYGAGRFPAIVAYCPALVNAGGAGTTPDERVANARLIAAAPELLAALQELCADKYLADPINADRMANARAAIAKATGE